MAQKSGLVPNKAVKENSFVRLFPKHGANLIYARPLHRVVLRRYHTVQSDSKDEWRRLVEMLVRDGADVKATTRLR